MGEIIRKKVNKKKFRNICSSTVSPDKFYLSFLQDIACNRESIELIFNFTYS